MKGKGGSWATEQAKLKNTSSAVAIRWTQTFPGVNIEVVAHCERNVTSEKERQRQMWQPSTVVLYGTHIPLVYFLSYLLYGWFSQDMCLCLCHGLNTEAAMGCCWHALQET